MSKRKPCNRRVQIERSMRALINTNHAAVINIDPSGLQVMINWKNGKQILSRTVSDALCAGDVYRPAAHDREALRICHDE